MTGLLNTTSLLYTDKYEVMMFSNKLVNIVDSHLEIGLE